MTYDDKCYHCPYRQRYVDEEITKAKEWYDKTGVSWRFECGASYHPQYTPEVKSVCCRLDSVKQS